MRHILTIITLLCCFALAPAQNNQKLKDLERQRKATLEQIAGITKQLNQNKKSAAYTLQKLNLLEKQIDSRKKLISLLNEELTELETEITKLEAEIAKLEKELNIKKSEYGKSVQRMFMKRSSYEMLMFIFSSNSLSEAYRRTRYLKEYAIWSHDKGEEIKREQTDLNIKKGILEESKADKESLLALRQNESKKLEAEEKKQKEEAVKLKKQQKTLQSNLSKQKQQAAALNQQIQRIIQEEIRRAQEEARRQKEAEERKQRLADEEAARKRVSEGKSSGKTSTKKEKTTPVAPSTPSSTARKADTEGGYAMTREEKILSDDFSKNRGSLPAPLNGRFKIVGHFGQQQHEDLKYVVTNNNGVDIQTDAGTDARAVFKGVVSKVFAVPGYNSSVIIRHGNFLTVYSNLSRVYVSAGDRVSTKQSIGRVYSDSDNGNQTVLHFQLWKETSKQNPESWINF